jgi:LuxR family maltose regulon positive regulatory protein
MKLAGARDVALLRTKLYIPSVRPGLVSRPRLVDRLSAGSHRKLTLISAPAGFGKTTLVTEWVCGGAAEVAWISLDEGDNDPVQFLQYLIVALQQVDGNLGQTLQQLLQSPQLPPPENLITPLINDLAAVDTALTLVLDDYHLITFPGVHHMVQFLLEHQPPTMHLVLSTREDPPLPLVQMRVRGQVTEIRERDLRFTLEEAAAFLNRTMGLDLSPETVEALEARTEGWIAGLQLAALALQEDRDADRAPGFVADFAGDDRYVMDYLVVEVLQRQPEATRAFLRQTSILDRLSAPLCDALTGRQDSQAILERLEGANLFLTPLDHRREWYRYYHLFAGSLRATLDRDEQKRLHQRAARWYERHGATSQAIHHALAYGEVSGDLADAERLVRAAAAEMIHSGNLVTVRGWLDALSDERVRADGELATYKGWMLALSGEIAAAEEYADLAERHLRKAEDGPTVGLGRVLVLRSFIAVILRQDYERAIALATEALHVLGDDLPRWRVMALWTLAESQERTRNITEAIATLRQAQSVRQETGDVLFMNVIDAFLAVDLYLYGRRREAVRVCQEALKLYVDREGRPSPMASFIYSRLGTLYYAANQLALAQKHLEEGLRLSDQFALSSPYTFARGSLAPVLYAQGEADAALAALQEARELAAREALGDAGWLSAAEADIRLKEGDVRFALQWADSAGLPLEERPTFLRIEMHLVYVRLLLAQGRLADARRRLARLESFLRERGLYRRLITVYILQAITAGRSGDHASAVEILSRSVEIAAPEDYYRAFLDEDRRVLALLPDVRDVAPAFVDQLLGYGGGAAVAEAAAAQPLVEPLSDRELEVLRLIAAGLANREIAEELVIATGTVKRHINHIYGKLAVGSRTQAIAKARELRLLK